MTDGGSTPAPALLPALLMKTANRSEVDSSFVTLLHHLTSRRVGGTERERGNTRWWMMDDG
jgi:hypothetical protein